MNQWLFKLLHNRLVFIVICVLLAYPTVILFSQLLLMTGTNIYSLIYSMLLLPALYTFLGLYVGFTIAWALLLDQALESARDTYGFKNANEVRIKN